MQREDVHAVIIATPNFTHAPIALDAIAHGKHVLCEKPLALNYADAQAMADAADRAGVRHMTAFTYRFVPAMRYLRISCSAATWASRITTAPAACRTGARAASAGGRSRSSPAPANSATCSAIALTSRICWSARCSGWWRT